MTKILIQKRKTSDMVTSWRASASGTNSTPLRPSDPPEGMVGRSLLWIRKRILSVALSAASFITLVSLIAPAWLDFLLDLSMVGLVALVGKLARK
jgi:hypothetical protein